MPIVITYILIGLALIMELAFEIYCRSYSEVILVSPGKTLKWGARLGVRLTCLFFLLSLLIPYPTERPALLLRQMNAGVFSLYVVAMLILLATIRKSRRAVAFRAATTCSFLGLAYYSLSIGTCAFWVATGYNNSVVVYTLIGMFGCSILLLLWSGKSVAPVAKALESSGAIGKGGNYRSWVDCIRKSGLLPDWMWFGGSSIVGAGPLLGVLAALGTKQLVHTEELKLLLIGGGFAFVALLFMWVSALQLTIARAIVRWERDNQSVLHLAEHEAEPDEGS